MDSMRSLNTSLPRARAARPADQPNVHQSFRTAALTVTNLYKSAIADIEGMRTEGYQEAIEDLLNYLDKQKLGVGDGEGWKIRQWATERLEGALPGHGSSDSDEDAIEEKRARSSSPAMERHSSPPEESHSSPPPHAETVRSDSAPAAAPSEDHVPDVEMQPPQGMFHFSSPHAYPSRDGSDSTHDQSTTPRRNITPRRPSTRSSRNLQRAAAQNILGTGAGHKRRMMEDLFNIDSVHDRHDRPDRRHGNGGSKRGRMG